jgi:predicted MFS family arabinose efflux permease
MRSDQQSHLNERLLSAHSSMRIGRSFKESNGPETLSYNSSKLGALSVVTGSDDGVDSQDVSFDLEELGLKRWHVQSMCAILFLFNILNNVDHGALPSGISDMQEDFGLPTFKMGHFGSLVFLGLASGSLCVSMLVGIINWKTLLMCSFVGNGVGLFLYSASSDYFILCFARWLSGFNQAFLVVYMPLYIDAFTSRESKSLWMSNNLLAPPLGVMIGYGITAIIIKFLGNWRISFIIQGFSMGLAFIIILFIPTKFFDLNKVN